MAIVDADWGWLYALANMISANREEFSSGLDILLSLGALSW